MAESLVAMQERYAQVRFTELTANAPAGPTASVMGWVLIVTGLNEETQEEDVHDAFADHGELKNVYMNLDRQTGFAKGYALVEFKERKGAEAAISALNGSNLMEKKIAVDWAFISKKK
jgi:RNA-binding protein 8A